ncbi:hypothetical protein OF829_11185 [Sphingomonas sp. LB-2]|uniref:hypothetical protein n=1 Tax=Sphingomonas caeni TaxID=2984949 RepID=UPI00222FE586|nr:hypothetical protein [Sphingomonas caeni]MCW3847803.1 hypothetical protein [Sphingomonas caeni]
MKIRILLCLPFLLAACVTTGTAAQTRPEGVARIGQTVRVGGPTVRPIAVIEDSRCPSDVTCVWSGRLVVRVEVGTGRGKRRMDLTLGTPVHVADGALTLREALPGKLQGRKLSPRSYRFMFTFSGGL